MAQRELCVSRLPGRKRPCLCIEEGATCTVLASFNSVDSVAAYLEVIREILGDVVSADRWSRIKTTAEAIGKTPADLLWEGFCLWEERNG